MALGIEQRLDRGFSEPLGLLSDCHRRIEYFLNVLIAIDATTAGGPLTASGRDALDRALRYFAVGAPKHTRDEEESLFPRLRNSSDPRAREAMALIDRLEGDHQEAEEHHAKIDMLARRWLADDRLTIEHAAELRHRLSRLRTLYTRHLAMEDQELFPIAAEVLTARDIRQIGREMATRRFPGAFDVSH
jgi:hemerythrin-like domain-containing protein